MEPVYNLVSSAPQNFGDVSQPRKHPIDTVAQSTLGVGAPDAQPLKKTRRVSKAENDIKTSAVWFLPASTPIDLGEISIDLPFSYQGETKNNLPHGKGKIFDAQGVLRFEGDLLSTENNGFIAHGFGKCYDSDGTYYEGQFKDNLYCGQGRIVSRDGQVISEGIYRGFIVFGTRYDKDGRYEGHFLEGIPHGQGKYIDSNGKVVCEGEFEEGILVRGIKYEDTVTLQGHFKSGELHGQGKMTFQTCILEGYFENSLILYGKKTTDESTYEGYFRNNLFHGKGTLTWKRYKYEGDFENNLFHGLGTLTEFSSDSQTIVSVYEGQFECGSPQGRATLKSRSFETRADWVKGRLRTQPDTDKEIYEGEFKAGIRHGLGTAIGPTYVTSGLWRNDRIDLKATPQKLL